MKGVCRTVCLTVWLAAGSGCALMTEPLPDNPTQQASTERAEIATSSIADTEATIAKQQNSEPLPDTAITLPAPLSVSHIAQTGSLGNKALSELSGMVASRTMPGVLFAVNDSGNLPMLFALSETGEHLHAWTVDTINRDWEDMATTRINGTDYLVIGDTGDNLRIHRQARLLFFREPVLSTSRTERLTPEFSIEFTYEDGPRNVEAFAIDNGEVLLISKEPVTEKGPSPSHLYTLQIPAKPTAQIQKAVRVATLPLPEANLESRMVAAITGVDLNHPTAMDFDTASNTAYVLTYRHVLAIKRTQNQGWADAFTLRPRRIHSHQLEQAEALAVTPGRAIWFSSENPSAPLWAIPISSPL